MNECRGIRWKSDRDLSRKLGKYPNYVAHHLSQGKTYDEIIDYAFKYKEYKGIEWSSERELAEALKVSRLFIRTRRNSGLSYQDIIDEVLFGKYSYKGFYWNSDSDLSRKLGKSNSFVSSYIKQGKTREEIIDMVLDKNKKAEEEIIRVTKSIDAKNLLESNIRIEE